MRVMSDSDVPTESNDIFEVVTPDKMKKKKRVYTDEQKEKMKENLRRGREKSAENRRKRALLKKMEQEAKQKEMDDKIAAYESAKKKKEQVVIDTPKVEAPKQPDPNAELYNQLKELRSEMASMKAQTRQRVAKPKASKPIPIEPQAKASQPKPAQNPEPVVERFVGSGLTPFW